MKDLLWSPVIAIPWVAILTLIVLLLVGWSLWHGLRSRQSAFISGGLRLGALAILVIILLQPQRRYDEVTILKPQLAVVIDTSESMSDTPDEAQPKRADRVREWLEAPAMAAASEAFDVRLFAFDARVNELGTEAGDLAFKGSGSNVVAAINQVQERFRGQPLAGIALLSDGLDTSGVARGARISPGVPVFTFELEQPFTPKEKPRRLSLGGLDYPARIVVGWDQEIRASVVGSGMSGITVPVELWRDGVKEREETIAFNEDEQTRPVVFPLAADKPGMIQFELRVKHDAADRDARAHPFVVEALPPGKRILYVQNSLGFDFKFLRKAIVSDRNLQLAAYVRWGDGRIVAMGERGLPAEANLDLSPGGLQKFSVVMLGDLAPSALTAEHLRNLKDFVDRGGGLILLGGGNMLSSPEFAASPLAEILPVKLPAEYREQDVPVTITESGLRHPVFGPLFNTIKDFPPLLTVNATTSSGGATVEVLVEGSVGGQSVPLIAASRFGQGRVVVVLTDTIWRWRLAAKSLGSERSPYDTFWTQLMDWLIPKEQDKEGANKIELFTERANYLLGERPEVRAIVRLVEEGAKPPASLPLTVRTPDEKVFEYTMKAAMLPVAGGGEGAQVPGYRVEVEPNVPGVFAATSSVTIGSAKVEGETRFVVARPATELTQKPIDRELLARIAEESGGRMFPLGQHGEWVKSIRYKEQQFARMQVADLWNHPILLALLLGLLAADWVARKLWNLP